MTAERKGRFSVLPGNLRGLLIRLALYYGAICVFVYLIQDRLLYYPVRVALEKTFAAAAKYGLTPWPEANADYHGFVRLPETSPTKGTVVVFHGNAGTAADRGFYADALCPLGYRVLLIEYPGYGSREGRIGEKSLVSAAVQSIELAGKQYGQPLFVMGESLGSAVGAAAAAKSEAKVAGVAAITPWHNLPDLAQATYWYLPARLLARDQYLNAKSLNELGQRVAVCIAEEDTIVPPVHGERLFNDLNVVKRKWIFPGVGHNSWPTEPGHAWWSGVMNFLAADEPVPVP